MYVRDPDTEKLAQLYDEDEYLAELKAFHASACQHKGPKEIRLFTASNGAVHCRYQCLTCGEATGQNLPKSDFDLATLLPFDRSLAERFKAARLNEENAIARKHLTKQATNGLIGSREYRNYMASDEWRRKSDKAIKRANGICEGCGDAKATQAHHRTYAHFRHEFLFELLALCPTCHARIHAEEHPDADADIESPCCACRFQAQDEQGRDWCGCHDTPAQKALAVDGPCGPNHKSEEPLK